MVAVLLCTETGDLVSCRRLTRSGGQPQKQSKMSENCNAANGGSATAADCTTPQNNNAQQQQHSMPLALVTSSIREYLLQTLTSTPFVTTSVQNINIVATYIGVPQKSLLTNEEFVLSSTAMIVTLLGYYVLFGKRHRRKRKVLAEELRQAQRQVRISFYI